MDKKKIIIYLLLLSNIMTLGVGYAIGNMVGYFEMSYAVQSSNEIQEIKEHVNYVFNLTEKYFIDEEYKKHIKGKSECLVAFEYQDYYTYTNDCYIINNNETKKGGTK